MPLATQLLLLLPLLATCGADLQDVRFVQSVIQRVADEERWTNTPLFMSHPMGVDHLNPFIEWLHTNLSVTSYVFDATGTKPDTYNPLRNHIKNDALSLLFCYSSDEIIFWHLDKRLRKLRGGRLIVYLSNRRQTYALDKLFRKLWSLQFLQVLVLHKQRVYGYTPYPTVRYFELNLTRNGLLFPAQPRDLNGYVVSTPAENDLPRVFQVRDQRTGAHLIRGFGYRIFAEFLRRHNAQLVISNAGQDLSAGSSVDMSRINQLIGDNRLEITMHPYVGIDRKLGILSYPLTIAQNCLIIPVRNEIPRYMYLLRPFHWSSWLLLLAAVVYISLALHWLSPGLSASHQFGLSLLEALCQLLFLSSPTRIYGPSVRYFLVALQLSVLGFIVTNWYSNQLSSSLTATLVGEQVDTFEQLIAQQQRILVKHHEIPMLLQQVPPHLEQQVNSLVVGSEAGEQVRALLSFNISYSYPFTVERWEFFALQQQYAQKPIYRYSGCCLGAPVIGYPMRKDSHLESLLKDFIMWVQCTGLFQYWVVSDFNDALRAGFVRLIDNSDNFKALNLDTLRLAWYVLLCGWLLAALVFVCEHRLRIVS
ncbi:hypothetical protein KR044_004036, partial [Drosophila immigrans]